MAHLRGRAYTIERGITLDVFKDLRMDDTWRELSIEGMYRRVVLHRGGNRGGARLPRSQS